MRLDAMAANHALILDDRPGRLSRIRAISDDCRHDGVVAALHKQLREWRMTIEPSVIVLNP
jgi:hypothetical protein